MKIIRVLSREHPADTTYRVDVNLSRLLDLQLREVRDAIELSDKELFAPWRRAKKPTTTQMLEKSSHYPGNFLRFGFRPMPLIKDKRLAGTWSSSKVP